MDKCIYDDQYSCSATEDDILCLDDYKECRFRVINKHTPIKEPVAIRSAGKARLKIVFNLDQLN